MFHPGETVINNFVIPFEKADISQIIVTYKQFDDIVLERTITSADRFAFIDYSDPAKTKFRIQLSQEESLLFNENTDYKIQLNVYTEGGSRHASCEIRGTNGVQHYKEVIPNG